MQQPTKMKKRGYWKQQRGYLVCKTQEEEGLHGVHKRLRRDKRLKNKRRPQEVQRKTGCHPKEANPKKASVCET
jgi:hypothetical protein